MIITGSIKEYNQDLSLDSTHSSGSWEISVEISFHDQVSTVWQ